MKRVLLATLAILLLPVVAGAQAPSCPGCVLGIYDALDLAKNFGTMSAGAQKDIFVGIKFDPNDNFDSYTGVEFSVTGLDPFIVIKETFNNPAVELGDPKAPADTTSGSGGINVAWAECQTGSQAFMKLTLIALGPPPDDQVLQVLRKFPPSNPNNSFQLFTQCDAPAFTSTRLAGGCYVVNPTVGAGQMVGNCLLEDMTAVEKQTWSTTKALYR